MDSSPRELSLFSGIGGGLLGTRLLGWRTVCYVEKDEYCQQVLIQRIKDGYLDDAPIWDDVRTFDGYPWAGCVDVITAGFPCQPWSVAGKRKGAMDERNMWVDTVRIIREVRPKFCLLENVPGLLRSGYFETILKDLAESGYDARWKIISAAEMGAPHKRDRLWIVCTNTSIARGWRLPVRQGKSQQENIDINRLGKEAYTYADKQHDDDGRHDPGAVFFRDSSGICDPKSQRLPDGEYSQVGGCQEGNQKLQFERSDWWKFEPGICRVADWLPNRVDRIRTIGNGQVPAVVRAAWDWLIGE